MKTRRQIRSDARRVLSTHYGEGLVVAFLFSLITWTGIAILALPLAAAVLRGFLSFSWEWQEFGLHIGYHLPEDSAQLTDFVANIMVVAVLALAVLTLFTSLVAGLFRFHYKSATGRKSEISNLFYPMKLGFFKGLRMLLLMEIKTTLWGLIGEIPGGILIALSEKSFHTNLYLAVVLNILGVLFMALGAFLGLWAMLRHSMAFFAMAQDDSIGVWHALHRAEKLMSGNILRLITLNLSLMGWYLLAIFTGGIGFLFLQPYALAVNTVFFCDISGTPLYFEKEEEETQTAEHIPENIPADTKEAELQEAEKEKEPPRADISENTEE